MLGPPLRTGSGGLIDKEYSQNHTYKFFGTLVTPRSNVFMSGSLFCLEEQHVFKMVVRPQGCIR